MTWQFCEIVRSRQMREWAVCGRPMPAQESKVCIYPVKKHGKKFRDHYHRTCSNNLIGPMIETLLA
jgi:hypothetical protein